MDPAGVAAQRERLDRAIAASWLGSLDQDLLDRVLEGSRIRRDQARRGVAGNASAPGRAAAARDGAEAVGR
jgi:hypothetical protein